MSVTSAPGLLGLDWGTTALRGYRLDARGAVVETRGGGPGIMNVQTEGFEAALAAFAGDWLNAFPDCPVLACGMVGSRQGWREVPYLDCPAGPADLAGALQTVTCADGRHVAIVPGLVRRGTGGLPDVMRGEETQIAGLGAHGAGVRLVVLPGTHSKWARVEGERIESFTTFMTGEVYGLLRDHGILGRAMRGDAHDPDAFARGVSMATRARGLLGSLFSTRTLGLTGELDDASAGAYLSGLLIGTEFREALTADTPSSPVVIAGAAALAARYAEAAALLSVATEITGHDIAANGLARIARAAGLIGADT